MQPRARRSRALHRPPKAAERCTPFPPRRVPSARHARRGAWCACALGVCVLPSACQAAQLPSVALVYRLERDPFVREHRVELRLSSARPPRDDPFAYGPEWVADGLLDPCPEAPHCEARERWIDEAERRFTLDDRALEHELGRPLEHLGLESEGRIGALREELAVDDATHVEAAPPEDP